VRFARTVKALLLAAAIAATAQAATVGKPAVAGGATVEPAQRVETPATEAPMWKPQEQAAPGDLERLAPRKYESVHFTLRTDFVDEAYVRRLQGDLEKYFSRMQKEFWDFIRPEHREAHIVMAVFDSQESFDTLAGEDAAAPRGEMGYSNKSASRVAFVRQDEYYKDIMIAAHELTHVFNRFSVDQTPIWLDEGMAQYYANYAGEECGNRAIESGINAGAIEAIDAALKEGRFAGIPALLGMDDAAFYGEASGVNYAESWALVYYLRRGMTGGDDTLARYYQMLKRGDDHYRAFMNVYGELATLEKGWLGYLEGLYTKSKAVAPGTQPNNADKPTE
jgi:hypothetical protein